MRNWLSAKAVAAGATAGVLLAGLTPAISSAALTTPSVSVDDAGQGVLDTVSSNLPTILTVFGVLLGISVILRLFRRFAK